MNKLKLYRLSLRVNGVEHTDVVFNYKLIGGKVRRRPDIVVGNVVLTKNDRIELKEGDGEYKPVTRTYLTSMIRSENSSPKVHKDNTGSVESGMDKVITYGPDEFRIFFNYSKKVVNAIKMLPRRRFVSQNGNVYWAAPLIPANIEPLSKFATEHGFRVDVRAAAAMKECLEKGVAPVINIRGVFIEGELTGFILVTPGYYAETNAIIKSSGSARWNPENKTWNLPLSRAAAKAVEVLTSQFNFTIEEGLAEKVNAYAIAFDAVVEASAKQDAEIDIPAPSGLSYMPFQKAGIAYAFEHGNALIADEPGLGKTIQVIGFSNMIAAARRVLVIVPTTLVNNWKREFLKWDVKGLSVGIVRDGKSFPNTEVVIVSYDLAIKHIARIHEIQWDILAVDEAHNLKNPKGKRCKHIIGFEDRNDASNNIEGIQAKHVLMLTGTPIVNRPKELWPLIHRVNPTRWDNFWSFGKRYCDAENTGYGWVFNGASNLNELQDELRANGMVRRIKADVLPELPKKIRQIIPVEDAKVVKAEKKLIQKQLDVIKGLKEEKLLAYLANNKEAYYTAARELKQAVRTGFKEMAKARHTAAVAKVPHVIEMIEETLNGSGVKLVVFCHHLDVIDAYKAAFGDRAVTVDGRVSPTERQARIDRFVNDPACTLFIGGIRAAGVGVDGLQKVSSHVIFAEVDCVPGVMTQAEDRLCRIGQKDAILVWHVVIDGTIDARMVELTVDKQEIIDAAMDDKTERTEVKVADNQPEEAEAVEAALGTLDIVSAEEVEAWLNGLDARKEIAKAKSRGERITEKAEKKGLAAVAAEMTEEQISAVHRNLMFMSGRCDGAIEQDGLGFNAMDTFVGKTLAAIPVLNNLQAAYAREMLAKYVGQLGSDAVGRMKA